MCGVYVYIGFQNVSHGMNMDKPHDEADRGGGKAPCDKLWHQFAHISVHHGLNRLNLCKFSDV